VDTALPAAMAAASLALAVTAAVGAAIEGRTSAVVAVIVLTRFVRGSKKCESFCDFELGGTTEFNVKMRCEHDQKNKKSAGESIDIPGEFTDSPRFFDHSFLHLMKMHQEMLLGKRLTHGLSKWRCKKFHELLAHELT
jgi:hypothetical protein